MSVLKNSVNPIVTEQEILTRVDNYLEVPDIYLSMLSLLSNIGGIKTFQYLQSKLSTSNIRIESIAKNSIKQLGFNTKDPKLKQQIQDFIKN
ncbi:hypothetical protein [Dyadobacter sp. NIV53]|uniref:hypothetical protein n=1 Tax=Dyadobacter sp. NIV53 TaxID=2861765 RepID=UPI001C88CEAF|nr:hypothetical protein [Dyadobacter sp. NIV53]